MACTGLPELDANNLSSGYEFQLYVPSAFGLKFVPTSKCLYSVVIQARKVTEVDMDLYIISDDGLSPSHPTSFPSQNQYIGTSKVLASALRTDYKEVEFVFSPEIELSDLKPLWAVITAGYNPTQPATSIVAWVAGSFLSHSGTYIVEARNEDHWGIFADVLMWYKSFKLAEGTPICPVCDFIAS